MWLPLLVVVAVVSVKASGEDPRLAALLLLVDAELHLLQAETDAASQRGHECYLERASLEVGRFYRNVSAADASEASMAQLLRHYKDFYADAPAGFAAARARSLPLREANDTLGLLKRARAALAAAPARPPLPSRDLRSATVCDGYLCNRGGQPIIPTVRCSPHSAPPGRPHPPRAPPRIPATGPRPQPQSPPNQHSLGVFSRPGIRTHVRSTHHAHTPPPPCRPDPMTHPNPRTRPPPDPLGRAHRQHSLGVFSRPCIRTHVPST